jgi:hypothetical protein
LPCRPPLDYAGNFYLSLWLRGGDSEIVCKKLKPFATFERLNIS